MANVRTTLKLTGLNKLMRSAPVQRRVDALGRDMAAEAGPGFEYEGRKPHKWTARGFVQTSSRAGARRQAKEAVLERLAARRRS